MTSPKLIVYVCQMDTTIVESNQSAYWANLSFVLVHMPQEFWITQEVFSTKNIYIFLIKI